MAAGGLIIPPLNFELVAPGVYRSGFPTRRNIEFLRRLSLRSVLRLSDKKYSPEVLELFAANRITVVECGTEGNRVRAAAGAAATRCAAKSR
jgi:tyrosine-protein phosphatase SIW14